MLERFDRELTHGTHDTLHERDLEAEAIPDGGQRTGMTRDLSGERVTLGKSRIEFCPDPKKPAWSCIRNLF